MQLSPLLKVLVILNNYFHDVATAMLLSSALILWLLGRRARQDGPEAVARLASAYPSLTRVAQVSLVWIVVGGVPRALFFQQVEWNMADPSNRYLFGALMVKHAFMWAAVGAGAVMWFRLRKVASEEATAGAPDATLTAAVATSARADAGVGAGGGR